MKKTLNFKQRLVVVVMDVLLLTELTVCIYFAHQYQDDMTGIFLRSFIPAALITVVVSRILMRKMHTPEPESMPAGS